MDVYLPECRATQVTLVRQEDFFVDVFVGCGKKGRVDVGEGNS